MTQTVESAMAAFSPELPLAVAFSGGADSTALLRSCADRWPGQVVALHVNHGLQAAAAEFERHCVDLCARWKVPIRTFRVQAAHAPGESPEAAARNARYRAFSSESLATPAGDAIQTIAIGQHADDQVETLMLALGRGAGVAGLAAMPARWQRNGLRFARPLLRVSASEIRQWLSQRGIDYVEDPTNACEDFTRNRIRARILPALRAVFPAYLDTFARTARHAAQAQELLDALAIEDLHGTSAANAPSILQLQTLTNARLANVLRYWLKAGAGVIPSAAQLDELVRQVQACTTRGHAIDIKVGDGMIRRSGDTLHWYNP